MLCFSKAESIHAHLLCLNPNKNHSGIMFSGQQSPYLVAFIERTFFSFFFLDCRKGVEYVTRHLLGWGELSLSVSEMLQLFICSYYYISNTKLRSDQITWMLKMLQTEVFLFHQVILIQIQNSRTYCTIMY